MNQENLKTKIFNILEWYYYNVNDDPLTFREIGEYLGEKNLDLIDNNLSELTHENLIECVNIINDSYYWEQAFRYLEKE